MTASRRTALMGLLAIATLVTAPRVSSQSAVTIGSYQLVSTVFVTRTVSQFTYKATLTNGSIALTGATATAVSLSPFTVLVDDTLTFGPVGPGGAVVAADTFSFRHDRTVPFNWSNIQ